jgi:hypothetical protein
MSENGSRGAAARASATAVTGVLAGVGLMLLVVTWAATIGPQQVLSGGNRPSYPSLPPLSPTPTPKSGGRPPSGESAHHDLLFLILMIAVMLFAAVLMLAVVLTTIRWLLTRNWRRRREPDPEEIAFDPLDAPALLAESIVADAGRQREALATGSPRNAIVACWHSFEEQAEAAGVRRQRWETSSEFTMRVLDTLSADDTAVLRLAELYRDARHSAHEISERDRRSAAEALAAIHRSLDARARGTTAGSP